MPCCTDCEERGTIIIDGEWYCEDCGGEDYFHCGDCGDNYFTDHNAYLYVNGEMICEDCIDNYFHCDCCDEHYHNDSYAVRFNGDEICNYCFDNHYFRCDSCGDIYHNDDYAEDGYCINCYREEDDGGGLHSYEYRPHQWNYHGASNPYYGIELETDKYFDRSGAVEGLKGLDYDEENYFLKYDGSLDNGIEVVFHPRNFTSWSEYDLQPVLKAVKRHGGSSYDAGTCGIHIHRSKADLSEVTTAKLIMFFGQNSNRIVKVAQRRSANYASYSFFEDNNSGGLAYKAIKHGETNGCRYMAINFQNADTVEFRVFKGTLKEETIRAYLAFTHYCVEYCKGALLSSFIKGSSWQGFCDYLRTQKGKEVENLISYMERKGVFF